MNVTAERAARHAATGHRRPSTPLDDTGIHRCACGGWVTSAKKCTVCWKLKKARVNQRA